jgi:hypothetical protein
MTGRTTHLVERRFTTRAAPDAAWRHLSNVGAWPSWARHIKRVTLDPPGALSSTSRGRIVLQPGVPTTFSVTALDEGRSWSWRGRFAGTTLDYDHVVEPIGREAGSAITFSIDGSGSTVGVVGPLFSRVYGAMLDRAIPNLIRELDEVGGAQAEQAPSDPEPN